MYIFFFIFAYLDGKSKNSELNVENNLPDFINSVIYAME